MEISVVIPTYRPGIYLFECLNSVINQDYPHDNFEIIIVLNGDKYPYFTEIELFIQDKKTQFQLIYSQQKGVSNARNIALDNTSSTYIVFLDDDDILSSNYLSLLYSDISYDSITVSDVKTFFNDLSMLEDDYISKCYHKCKNGKKYSLFKYRSFLSSSCAKMIPRSIIDNFRFDKNLNYGEDGVFMFAISCNIRDVRLANENAIYYRRMRSGSVSRTTLSLMARIRILMLKLFTFSFVYLKAINRYNLLLFLSRIAAAIKSL